MDVWQHDLFRYIQIWIYGIQIRSFTKQEHMGKVQLFKNKSGGALLGIPSRFEYTRRS